MKGIFLIARYVQRPKDPSMTRFADYMKDPDNMQWDEEVQVANKVRDKDMTQAQVILNLMEGIVVRNSFNENREFKSLFKYFYEGYEQYIQDAVKAINPNLTLVVPEEQELPVATDEEVKAE